MNALYDTVVVRREVTGVAAHLKVVVPSYPDAVTGKQLTATADDYASLQLLLEPAKGAEPTPLWGPTGTITVRTWPSPDTLDP